MGTHCLAVMSSVILSRSSQLARTAQQINARGIKVVAALYADPKDGYPPKYARDSVPFVPDYAKVGTDGGERGQTAPYEGDFSKVSFKPGELLGCVSGELGLRKFLEDRGHTLVVTDDKDGDDSVFEREIVDADVVISQPFWPAYMTRERIEKAKNLKMCLTAGIGSDHIDLQAAIERNVSVTEVTYCNSISVSEHVVMQMLALVRNYIPSYLQTVNGGWNIADCVSRSYDLEGMHIGTIAAGRIGHAVLKRLHPFEVNLHYCDRHRLPKEEEERLNLTYHETAEEMVKHLDVVTINCPLHPETEHMFDEKFINNMKRGAYIVNTARGKICDRDAIAAALRSGQLAGYAGDVWFPQPPPKDHPWRDMPNHAMTPHISGTSLSAQARYCAGVQEILECFLDDKPIRDEYLIVQGGALAGTGAHSYSEGNATGGTDESRAFKDGGGNV